MTGEADELGRALAEQLPGLAPPDRRAAFLGLLQRHLPEGQDAILVGGGLVELLTEGTYVTGDLDLVADPDAVGPLLEQAGFERSGRHFLDEELGLAVEIVAPHLAPERRTERIRWQEHTLVVLSIEDLIVDRLCAAEHWDTITDHEQARIVYAAHRERIDEHRLQARADEEGVGHLLEGLEADGPDDGDG